MWGVLLLFLLAQPVFAANFPWVEGRSDDIQIIEDSRVEAELRLHLINQATQTLDIVTYDQRMGPLAATPFLEAIKNAAKRGVKVRFMTSWTSSMMKDPFNRVGRFLAKGAEGLPLEFHIVGGQVMWKKGWGVMDSIHEKILIADREWVLTTGRSHADECLDWLDTAFLIRGALVPQTEMAYEDLWTTVTQELGSRLDPLQREEQLSSDEFPPPSHELFDLLSQKQLKSLQRLKDWMAAPRGDTRERNSSGRSVRMRLLHYDLLSQLRGAAHLDGVTPAERSDDWRVANLKDPVVNEVLEVLADQTTQEMKFFTLSTGMNPKLKAGILAALERGARVSLMTNSRESHSGVLPSPYLIAAGWFVGLQDLDDLLGHGAKVFGLNPNPPGSPLFVHRKLAALGDKVIFGSHNLNFSSTVESDEISFEIESEEFSSRVNRLFNRATKKFGFAMNPEEISQERQSSKLKIWICSYFKGIY